MFTECSLWAKHCADRCRETYNLNVQAASSVVGTKGIQVAVNEMGPSMINTKGGVQTMARWSPKEGAEDRVGEAGKSSWRLGDQKEGPGFG